MKSPFGGIESLKHGWFFFFFCMVAFYWLSCDGLSLAELLSSKKREMGFAIIMGCESSPFWPPDSKVAQLYLTQRPH